MRKSTNGWEAASKLEVGDSHMQWVRDVAWAPNTAMPFNIIASCSDDKRVHIYQQTTKDGLWTTTIITLDEPVWRVSWSVTGNILAVSTSSHAVILYKQAIDGSWVQIANP
jgi:protein transport protein SEC13